MQHLVTGIPNVLLDLAFLPARRRIAELGLVDIVVRHGEEAHVDLPLLAAADPINSRAHVVVDAATRHAAEHAESVPVRVKQHLMGLQERGPDQKSPAVRQLDMSDLKLGAFAAQNRKVLAPVELESLARAESQRDERATPGGLLLALAISPPLPRKGRHTVVGTREAQLHQIGMQLLQRSSLLARLPGLGLQPARQLLGKRIQLARPLRCREHRLDRPFLQILLDGVPRQPGPARDLADRQSQPQSQLPDDVQKPHVDHSIAPRRYRVGERSHGSNLNGNQPPNWVSSQWKSTGSVHTVCSLMP